MEKYGRWTVISDVFRKGIKKYKYVMCECECGTIKAISESHLKRGKSKSCGCLITDILIQRNTTHNKTYTPEFNVWQKMVDRCRNINNIGYNGYGGRGIRVCDRWKEKFINFLEDMGPKPTNKHTIERKNNEGDYEPSNCRWATRREQARNRRPQRQKEIKEVGVFRVRNKFRAIIGIKGNSATHLGYFNTLDEAIIARESAKIKYWSRNV
jgi:hypothetical protein